MSATQKDPRKAARQPQSGTPAPQATAPRPAAPLDPDALPPDWEALLGPGGPKDWAELDGKDDDGAPPPDLAQAEQALHRVLYASGMPQNTQPFPKLVGRVKRNLLILRVTVVVVLTVATIIAALGVGGFVKGYVDHLSLRVEQPPAVATITPPSSGGVVYLEDSDTIQVQLLPGDNPLRLDTAAIVRVADGAAVPLTVDEATGAVSLPYQHITADYRLTLQDTAGESYTFIIHVDSDG